MTERPTYSNPMIAEAVCEIHFALAPGTAWSPSNPGLLWKEIDKDYPDVEPVIEAGVELKMNSLGAIEPSLVQRRRYRFTHRNKTRMIHIAEGVFNLSILPPYTNWQSMREEVSEAWSSTRKVFNIGQITRTGLRYINKIPRKSEDEHASHWLRQTNFVANAPLNSPPPFQSRAEVRISPRDRVTVTVAVLRSNPPHGELLFDIDCIREQNIEPDEGSVASHTTDLNDISWNIFHEAQTENFTKLLSGQRS